MNNKVNYRIVSVEGFDMVGKDYVIKNHLQTPEGIKFGTAWSPKFYRPEYKLFDQMFSRNDAWVIGYSILDFLSQRPTDNTEMVYFNRFIVSSLVYSELYGGDLHKIDNLRKIYDYYNYDALKDKGFDIQIYHVRHHDKSSAMRMMITSKDRDNNEPLDNFETFESYWMMYEDAESLFEKYYDLLGYKDHVHYVINKFAEE